MMAEADVSSLWNQLISHSKLDRDRGNQLLEESLKANQNLNQVFLDLTLNNAFNPDLSWQIKLGLLSTAIILSRQSNRSENLTNLAPKAIEWLSDDEVRVRVTSGEFLGALCKAYGLKIYENYHEIVFDLVREHIERAFERSNSIGNNESSGRMSPQQEILHDTAGWRNLETSVKCLQALIDGSGDSPAFHEFIDQNLLDLIFVSLQHQNRFVRETGYQTCATIIEVCSRSVFNETNPVYRFSTQFSENLAQGLSDNWSQVRMAAATAARQFLLCLKKLPKIQEDILSQLLPRLCLNRYYLAEGVRIYSQQTWMLVVGEEGKGVVEKDIEKFVQYYIECTKADNHAVREAACQCIAELAGKIDPNFVEPHVDILLDTLIECFQDESWPVRDMACVACGSFVSCYPTASRKKLPQLKSLFYENLQDPISSVRQGAALAIGKTVKVYGTDKEDPMVQEIVSLMTQTFENVQNQPVESHKYGNLSQEPANFGVVKQLRDNDPGLHENQTMYSCGSLAPKMKRGGGGGGCTDAKFRKPSEPWEAADGCLFLLAELSKTPNLAEILSNLLPKVEEAGRHRHYTMHYHLLETLAKIIPILAKNLGKKYFKPHVESFFDPLFYASDNDNYLAAASASQDCLKSLADFLGVNILKGRVDLYNHNYSRQLVSILEGGPMMNPMMGSRPGFGQASQPMSIPSKPVQPSLGGTPTGSPC